MDDGLGSPMASPSTRQGSHLSRIVDRASSGFLFAPLPVRPLTGQLIDFYVWLLIRSELIVTQLVGDDLPPGWGLVDCACAD